jgi:hypothetical protein
MSFKNIVQNSKVYLWETILFYTFLLFLLYSKLNIFLLGTCLNYCIFFEHVENLDPIFSHISFMDAYFSNIDILLL